MISVVALEGNAAECAHCLRPAHAMICEPARAPIVLHMTGPVLVSYCVPDPDRLGPGQERHLAWLVLGKLRGTVPLTDADRAVIAEMHTARVWA